MNLTKNNYNYFNEDFFESPDIYKTAINLNSDQVEESNTFQEEWELY